MKKIRRKQILKPILKPVGMPPMPLPPKKKSKKKGQQKLSKKFFTPYETGWNLVSVKRENLTKFMNGLSETHGVATLHIKILPGLMVGATDEIDVLFFYNPNSLL